MYSDIMSLVFLKDHDTHSTPASNVIDVRERITPAGFYKPLDGRRLRVVLYSHDTMGLGHIRRNLRLAQGLSESDLPIDVLLITGARESGGFSLPENCGNGTASRSCQTYCADWCPDSQPHNW